MNNYLLKIKYMVMNQKVFFIMFTLFVLIYIFTSLTSAYQKNNELITDSLDTFIPRGHVLVPIELENIETINGLIENFGVIDIYLGNKLTNDSKKILNKVKIIRAPLNPNKFAILLNDDAAKYFMKYDGQFVGAVQNKTEASFNPIVEQEKKKKINIEIDYNGDSK
ncbi:MAG: hypothetical protein ACK4VO_12055 [Pseudobdellovibrio sp.]